MAAHLNDGGRASSYGVVTWNAGGLHRGGGNGRQRGDWLLREWDEDRSLRVMAIQETHCKDDGDLCDGVRDMRARLNVFHSPAVEGDAFAGVMLVLTRDWGVIDSVVGVPGRVLSVRVKCCVTEECLNFVVVYGKTGGGDGGAWIDGLADVMDPTYATVVLGDFNFVEEVRDREGAATMNHRDRLLARMFRDKMGGWELHDVFWCLRVAAGVGEVEAVFDLVEENLDG